ncbi:QueT transporter family protein [Rubrobacter taiwanensis]|jgi:uncharacterized membrane protein|uniref:QueT transporter family protein n=1 Tax=Rubrobacter taiwanensis TaxID=185139 RepID=A0A4R1BDH7_9ACTN|nr:QueT transporter family protein [Rubrobacter taiwanensis]TCJ15130.1 QueT transporter family protein [Rubrobacter taiwanensis]
MRENLPEEEYVRRQRRIPILPRRPAHLAAAALIAGAYWAVTVVLAPISYGPVQVRVSEALTTLPYLYPPSIIGLWIGAAAANLTSPFGLVDVVFGSSLTLLAALVTRHMPRPYLAPLPPVVINALGVAVIITAVQNLPLSTLPATAALIGLGQLIACYGLGYPLLRILLRVRSLPTQ